jgi:hypothetical protein
VRGRACCGRNLHSCRLSPPPSPLPPSPFAPAASSIATTTSSIPSARGRQLSEKDAQHDSFAAGGFTTVFLSLFLSKRQFADADRSYCCRQCKDATKSSLRYGPSQREQDICRARSSCRSKPFLGSGPQGTGHIYSLNPDYISRPNNILGMISIFIK